MRHFLIFLLFLITVGSCTPNRSDTSSLLNASCQIDSISKTTILGNLEILFTHSVKHNEEDEVLGIVSKEFAYGDTTLIIYRIQYTEKGELLKIYGQVADMGLNPKKSEFLAVEFEYSGDMIERIIYPDVLIEDIEYDNGKAKSLKYYYHGYRHIDSSKTRLLEMEYDEIGNVVGLSDSRIEDGEELGEITIIYDTLCNPYFNIAVSLVPEFDLLSFISPNNWVKIKSKENSSIKSSRAIEYNEHGFPQAIKTNLEHGMVEIDSIFYN